MPSRMPGYRPVAEFNRVLQHGNGVVEFSLELLFGFHVSKIAMFGMQPCVHARLLTSPGAWR